MDKDRMLRGNRSALRIQRRGDAAILCGPCGCVYGGFGKSRIHRLPSRMGKLLSRSFGIIWGDRKIHRGQRKKPHYYIRFRPSKEFERKLLFRYKDRRDRRMGKQTCRPPVWEVISDEP